MLEKNVHRSKIFPHPEQTSALQPGTWGVTYRWKVRLLGKASGGGFFRACVTAYTFEKAWIIGHVAPCVYHVGVYTPKCLGNSDGLGRLEIFWFFDGLEKPFFSGPCVYHVGVYTPKCLGNSDGLEIFWAFFYRLHMGSMECLVSIYFISILFLFFSYRLLYSIKLKVYILYIPYTKVEMAPQTSEKHMKKQGSELPPQKNHEQGIHSTIHGYTLPRHSTTRQRPLIGRDDW